MRLFVPWLILGVLAAPAWAEGPPTLHSRSAIVLDAATGAEIFAKNADHLRAIASTTKIFVALAVRRAGLDLDGWTEIKRIDAREAAGGSRTRLPVGVTFRNKDLLRAMLMASDNRAPTALGRAAGLDRRALIRAMNQVAKHLHLRHTRFTCPNGLHGNVSTAREMAIALRAALEDDVLREIMGDAYQEVVGKGGHPRIAYGTTDRPLAAKQHHVIGGKTGFTSAAGYCFIVAARLRGKEIVMSFLDADAKLARFTDFDRMADWIERGAPGAKIGEGTRARRPHAVHERSKHRLRTHSR
jgi:D-alanyl-D-alanine endopeptidase (penicillin-binding protein 7)